MRGEKGRVQPTQPVGTVLDEGLGLKREGAAQASVLGGCGQRAQGAAWLMCLRTQGVRPVSVLSPHSLQAPLPLPTLPDRGLKHVWAAG